jgi:hypothetical protein
VAGQGLAQCPGCFSEQIVAVGDGAGTSFLCEDCMRCWHETMGWVALVDPRSCIDCRRQPDCLARLHERSGDASVSVIC